MPGRDAQRAAARFFASARGMVVTAVLVVAVAVVAAVGIVVLSRQDTDAAPGRAAEAVTPRVAAGALPARALSWLDTSLPHDAVVLADAGAARALEAKGFTPVLPQDAAGRRIQFVVATASLRDTAATFPAVATALRGSLPVAEVPDGAQLLTVRQVATVSSAAMSGDADTRRQAERQLLANPSVRTDEAAAAVLHAGGLDLRAATVLALIAANQAVDVVGIITDPAEHAVGRPARSIDLRVASIDAVRSQLDVVSSEYRAASVRTLLDGSVRLTWPVDVVPVTRPN